MRAKTVNPAGLIPLWKARASPAQWTFQPGACAYSGVVEAVLHRLLACRASSRQMAGGSRFEWLQASALGCLGGVAAVFRRKTVECGSGSAVPTRWPRWSSSLWILPPGPRNLARF